tara:strand:- start:28 stop:702 length:675 start_codon:yes stop_codon:yes gene_type:complete
MVLSNQQISNPQNEEFEELELQGIYGNYKITATDHLEVKRYRTSVLCCGLAFCIGIIHWLLIGPTWAWIWLLATAIALGLALKWIHIYLKPLHRTLQLLWGLGCIGIGILLIKLGSQNLLSTIASNQISILAIGPLFAAMTGLGFKEFFCFRRPEAIGITLLIPISLLGHLSGLINGTTAMVLLSLSAFLLFILGIRKFGMDPAADIGDKSVFTFLENQKLAKN